MNKDDMMKWRLVMTGLIMITGLAAIVALYSISWLVGSAMLACG